MKRYKKDQTWKRQEFIAKEIKDFQNDPAVKNVMFMLDCDERYIQLFTHKNEADNFVIVDNSLFVQALSVKPQHLKEGKPYYKESEVAIRDNMDIFLGYLDRFYVFVSKTLIEEKELQPYLQYWIDKIKNGIPENKRKALYDYIKAYKFSGAAKLLGVSIKDRIMIYAQKIEINPLAK